MSNCNAFKEITAEVVYIITAVTTCSDLPIEVPTTLTASRLGICVVAVIFIKLRAIGLRFDKCHSNLNLVV